MKATYLLSVAAGIGIGFGVMQLMRGEGSGENPEPARTQSLRSGANPQRADRSNIESIAPDRDALKTYLERRDESKEAMIAVALLGKDMGDLVALAERYPNDPLVQLAVIGSPKFPGDKSEWYRRFKKSQPDNLLASLLLGSHLLATGASEEGLAELRAGSGLSNYNDFTAEGAVIMEGALLELGYSPYEAKTKSAFGSPLEYSVQLQQGTIDLGELMEAAATDEEKTGLAVLGVAIGNQLSEGEAKQSVINRMFGLGMESMFLKKLDPDVQLPNFAKTPGEMLEEIKDERRRLGEEIEFVTERYEALDEQQQIHFLDRSRALGDAPAHAWLLEQFPAGG